MSILILVLLLLLLFGGLPLWPYSGGWGYGPSGIVGVIFVVLLLLLLLRGPFL